MKDEQIKEFGNMLKDFCGKMNAFCNKFSEVTGDSAPVVDEETNIEVTKDVPIPAPVDDTSVEGDFGEDEPVAEVNEEEVNKDLDSIKNAVDDVAESDVEESAETLKKTFSNLSKACESLVASPTIKNFSSVKEYCDKLFSAAEDAKTYTARRKAKRLFDCIKFFADTVDEVLNETDTETPNEDVAVTEEITEEPTETENFDACPECGKDPCECEETDTKSEEVDTTTEEDFGDETYNSPELDEALESFADKIPEDADSDLTEFCGDLMNFSCVATSKDDAARKIRFLKAFSAALETPPESETDAAKQEDVDPEVVKDNTEVKETTVTKLVEFSKLLRKTPGISNDIIKSFSSILSSFADKDAPKDEEKPSEDEKPEEKKEEVKEEEVKEEETPPPAEETKKEEEEAPKEEEKPEENPSEEEEATEDSEEDDEEVVIDKTEVANFSKSSVDAYGDYMKKMILR